MFTFFVVYYALSLVYMGIWATEEKELSLKGFVVSLLIVPATTPVLLVIMPVLLLLEHGDDILLWKAKPKHHRDSI